MNESRSANTSPEQIKSCKVSIIMPAYNGERYLTAAIESVLEQTYAKWELIIVDDGSTDNTARLVSEISETDNRIRYLYQANAGQANARNAGIKYSRGDLIAFLDQDDLWLKEKLALQVKAIEDSGVDVVFCDGFLFAEGDVSSEVETFSTIHGKYSSEELFRLLFMGNRIPMLSALVRKEIFSKVGLLDEDPIYQNCDDYELWLRLAANHAQFHGLPQKLFRYRLHSNQASQDKTRMIAAQLAVVTKYESTELLSEQEKNNRLSQLYFELVRSLADNKRFAEARAHLRKLGGRTGVSASVLVRSLVLRVTPGYYRPIVDWADHLRESFRYRARRLGNGLRNAPR